ncbi:MAG: hypothetical protein K0Q95_772 [Bacteroidota bacterium]|jgi:hypothetical protein|nr:hypothetical protein [Bacteroidota bacterium]
MIGFSRNALNSVKQELSGIIKICVNNFQKTKIKYSFTNLFQFVAKKLFVLNIKYKS